MSSITVNASGLRPPYRVIFRRHHSADAPQVRTDELEPRTVPPPLTESQKEFFTYVDDMYAKRMYKEAAEALNMDVHWKDANKHEYLWRLARCYFNLVSIKHEQKDFLPRTLNILRQALDHWPQCSNAHKWAGILIDYAANEQSKEQRLKQLRNSRKHLELAVECDPNDPVSLYLLAEYHLLCTKHTWVFRKGKIIKIKPPEPDLHFALSCAVRAEEIAPWFYPRNYLLICTLMYKLDRGDWKIKNNIIRFIEYYKNSKDPQDKKWIKEGISFVMSMGYSDFDLMMQVSDPPHLELGRTRRPGHRRRSWFYTTCLGLGSSESDGGDEQLIEMMQLGGGGGRYTGMDYPWNRMPDRPRSADGRLEHSRRKLEITHYPIMYQRKNRFPETHEGLSQLPKNHPITRGARCCRCNVCCSCGTSRFPIITELPEGYEVPDAVPKEKKKNYFHIGSDWEDKIKDEKNKKKDKKKEKDKKKKGKKDNDEIQLDAINQAGPSTSSGLGFRLKNPNSQNNSPMHEYFDNLCEYPGVYELAEAEHYWYVMKFKGHKY